MSSYNVRPPTQGEWAVLYFVGQAACYILGLVGFGFYFFARPEDPGKAELLREFSTIIFAIGLLFWLGRWVIRRFVG